MKRWTEAERRRLRVRRADHQSVRAIAAAHDRSEAAVRTALSRYLPPPVTAASHTPTVPAPATLVDAFLRKPSGTALPRIAVHRAPLAGRPGRRAPRTNWTDEHRTKIQALIDAGHTNAEIAGELGCTITTLAAWLHKNGVRRTASALKKQRSGARGPTAT